MSALLSVFRGYTSEYFFRRKEMTKTRMNINYLVKTAILSCIAFLLMYLEFPLPIAPPWLKMDFSDLPAVIAGFSLGPVSGVFVQLIKVLLFTITHGTTSGFVGELGNFLMGVALVLPSALLYKKHHNKKSAVLAMVIGILVMTVVSGLVNYFLLIPAYSKMMPLEAIIGACQAIIPSVDSVIGYCVVFAMPFTFMKSLLDCIIIFFSYKKLSPILHKQY